MAFGLEILEKKIRWEGHPKKSAEIGPFFDHQHLFLVGGFTYSLFSPLFGEDSHFD